MDIDFFSDGNNWVSNSVRYYKSSLNGKEKTIKISIKDFDFDFDKIAEQFDTIKNRTEISLDDITNKEKLMELDVYKISDILKSNPVSTENITIIMML